MRVGLVSPYSYTYPGGVGRHAEALAEEMIAQGHEVSLLAPCDPDDRLAVAAHRGARPERRPLPDHLVPLGRTIGWPANGAVSNIAMSSSAAARLREEMRRRRFDVVHVQQPNAPVVGWLAAGAGRAPLVGTFHTYATSRVVENTVATGLGARRIYNKLHVRIAVSEAARWTAERFYGGRYRVIPNGVDLSAAVRAPKPEHDHLRLLFVGRAEDRKGLPVLMRAFEALRVAGVPARLTVAGATREEVEPFLLEREGVEVAGRVTEAEKWRLLHEADVLCAPSLHGESFGMVLTESFASGTPVVCSDIAGYRDVARHEIDGLLVPPGRAGELGEALQALAADPERRRRMSAAARERAERFAWPRVASEVVESYEEARELHSREPARGPARLTVQAGLRPADGKPPRPPQRRLPSPEAEAPQPAPRRDRRRTALRRGGLALGAAAAAGLAALALDRIGFDSIAGALLSAAPVWVLATLVLMSTSLLLRAEAWNSILRAAMPGRRVRRADTARATMIGVLMSATLPARLGEPSRALVMARRLGGMRERFPIVLGTLVSQTLLNVLAIVVLGAVMLATVGLFQGREGSLALFALAPVTVLVLVALAPVLLSGGRSSRSARVHRAVHAARGTLARVRSGLRVLADPRRGAWAVVAQLTAWAVQWIACYALLVAFGLDHVAGIGAAAAVLFAINVTAVLPATPANLGIFQAACVAVLSAYGVSQADALAYGIVLQAAELATAVALGMPALLREGMSWRDMRLRALHAAPVELRRPAARAVEAEA